MNIGFFSVALGALSFAAGSLSAQTGKVVAERSTQSSSLQSTQLSEGVMPPKADDLPNAPQATPMNSGGPAHPPSMGPGPLLPQTFHDKFMAFAVATVGPRALVGPAFPAAIRMANPPSHYPNDWRQGVTPIPWCAAVLTTSVPSLTWQGSKSSLPKTREKTSPCRSRRFRKSR